MIVDSGESEIYIDESLASENFNNYSVSDVMSINSYTSDFYNENITKSNLKKLKSIELGHIFLFGNKYSKAFEFLIDGEKDKFLPFMGSYGIGVSRIPAAIIEGYDKKDGVIWPAKVSPFHAIILNLDKKSQSVENFCNDMYLDFKEKGIDIFYDDRDERPGIKFSDSDLLGIPFVIIVGKNFLNQRNITVVDKYSNQEIEIPENEAFSKIKQMIKIYD